jgi:predicted enzyme related to lactoylglutathione lyase
VKLIDETYALVGDHGGQPARGIGQAGPSSPYVGIVVYFPVDDVDSALARAERLGGRRVLDPVDTLVSRIAVSPTLTATESRWSVADHTDQRSSAPDTGDSSE